MEILHKDDLFIETGPGDLYMRLQAGSSFFRQ